MKMSLLDMVQDILSDMDADEVNSIDDTYEAGQVAQIIKSTYYAMIDSRNWPHTKRAITFDSSSDIDLPTHMKVQENLKELVFVNYNKAKLSDTRKRYEKVKYLDGDSFLRLLNVRNDTQDNIDIIIDPTGIELMIQNDKAPQYYTSFNDVDIVFDSYDNEVDSTLQSSKIQAQGYIIPGWSYLDDFIPDLPDEAFTALLEEAKSRAMFKLKQTQDIKAEQESTRQQRWLARKAWTVSGGIEYPNYGRVRRK